MNHWYEHIMGSDWRPPGPDPAWRSGRQRVEKISSWAANRPQPWLVNTGGYHNSELDWYADGVREFIRAAAPVARRSRFLKYRLKPLLAIPLIGTGAGGGALRAGQLVTALLPSLADGARGEDVDLALVLKNECSYTAAVQARNRSNLASGLPAELQQTAGRLAEWALQGRLVLFLGAGLSQAANLPGWRALLQQLAIRVGISPDDAALQGSFNELPFLDQARLMELQLERAHQLAAGGEGPCAAPRTIGCEVSQILRQYPCVGIGHALLASLPQWSRLFIRFLMR